MKRALISVSDKSNLVPFARKLAEHGYTLISTGGTAKALAEAGLSVIGIEKVTGFPEMMDGRVKTLHPKVHGGLLALRDDPKHVAAMKEHAIEAIDLVCVNLYPFEQTVAKPDVADHEAIEQIDIGGPSMIRSASKNHKFVTVVTDPSQYETVMAELDANKGETTYELRRKLAQAAFARTAAYDTAIAAWMEGRGWGASEKKVPDTLFSTQTGANIPHDSDSVSEKKVPDTFSSPFSSPREMGEGVKKVPDTFSLPVSLKLKLDRAAELRYGENPHQAGALYLEGGRHEASVGTARQLHGKELSFNNLYDGNGALELVKEIDSAKLAAAAVIKHANPCGFAVGDSPAEAFRKAYEGDPLAAFGGIVAFNRVVDKSAAEAITEGKKFLEVIIAPGYDADALELLRQRWKDVRILQTAALPAPSQRDPAEVDIKRITGGLLIQQRDLAEFDTSQWKHAAGPAPSDADLLQLRLAMTAVKHLKSNAVCLVRDSMLVGAGAGQMDRVASCRIAIEKAGERAKGACVGSDAFFPFRDGPDLLIKAGVKAIAQPGGSKKDDETIAACNEANVTLLLTGRRHFRH